MVLAHDISEGLRTQDVHITENVTFDTMLLTPNILEGLTNCGFYKPSPIQLHGIPLGKCGFDLFLEAKSGTGKTAVFTVIALEKLELQKGLQTIILAPTREIAAQTNDVIRQIGSSYEDLNVEVVIGGLPTHEDVAKFKKKVHIVVASPGRLRNLIQAHHIDVSAVRLLVLDEADKLMDRSFQTDLNYIFSVLPKEKQVIMSSATYPETLKSVMQKYVKNAQHICPDSTTILLGIEQLVITVKSNSNIVRQTQNRLEELLKILSKKQFKQCLIFCNYQVRVRDLYKMLMREKWPAEQLHGQQEQTDRLDALKTLQEYKCRILISTDLAARGIDASNVDLVINFEPPYEWQTYLHRIGRAGRFGSYGIAITILSEGKEELEFKQLINSINGSLELKTLWDEEKSEPNVQDSSSETSVNEIMEIHDGVHNELLNKLTLGNAKCGREPESLRTICDSFDEAKESNIESFDDLLTCFESHKLDTSSYNKLDKEYDNECFTSTINLDNYDSSYNKLDKESDNECFTSTINMQNNELQKVYTKNELEENLIQIREEINSSEIKTKKGEEEELRETNSKHEKYIKTPSKPNINKENVKVDNVLCDSSDLESNESQMYKALLDAGLPTCFSSSKTCRRKPNKKHYICSNDKNNISNTQKSHHMKQKETENINKHPQTRIKKNDKLEIQKETHFDRESHLPNTPIRLKLSEVDLNKGEQTNYSKNFKQYIHGTIDSQIYGRELESNCKNRIKYAIWYNQLKTYIDQVQMSLYIEELSKM